MLAQPGGLVTEHDDVGALAVRVLDRVVDGVDRRERCAVVRAAFLARAGQLSAALAPPGGELCAVGHDERLDSSLPEACERRVEPGDCWAAGCERVPWPAQQLLLAGALGLFDDRCDDPRDLLRVCALQIEHDVRDQTDAQVGVKACMNVRARTELVRDDDNEVVERLSLVGALQIVGCAADVLCHPCVGVMLEGLVPVAVSVAVVSLVGDRRELDQRPRSSAK